VFGEFNEWGGWRVSRIVSLKKELKDFCYFCSKDKVRCRLINLVEIHPEGGKSG